MTFDQSQHTFRGHKTWETAGAYLDNAFHYKADDTIGEDTFFDAVGEVASWLSASDEHLRAFERLRRSWLCVPIPRAGALNWNSEVWGMAMNPRVTLFSTTVN